MWIDQLVDSGVHKVDLSRVAARCRIELHGRGRGQTGMTVSALSRQYALMKPTVACAQYCSAIPGELGGGAQTRRQHVPRVQRAKAAHNGSCIPPLEVDRVEILADGAAVIEPEAGIDDEPVSYRCTVAYEERCGDELSAGVRRSAEDRLKRLPGNVEVLDTR